MPGDNVVRGAQPVEYGEETDFATELPEDFDYQWFGLGTSWSPTQGVEQETIDYLPEYDAANKLSKKINVKHSEMWESDITHHPQNDFDLLRFWTGEIGGTSDDVPSIQVGHIDEDNDEFQRLLGGVGEEVTVSVDEDGTFEVDGSFIFADGTEWVVDDYVGADGSHAAEDTTEPFKYADLANITYGGEPLDGAVESLEFSISNDIAVVKDPDAGRDTLIASLVPVDREITVDVTLTYSDFDMASKVRDYTPQDFEFDIDGTTFTISGVQFPELPFEMSPTDLISDSVSSDPAADIIWA